MRLKEGLFGSHSFVTGIRHFSLRNQETRCFLLSERKASITVRSRGPNFAASLKEAGNSGGDTIKIAGGTIRYSRSSASQSTTDFPVVPGGKTVVACGSLLAFIAVSSSLNRQVGEGKRALRI